MFKDSRSGYGLCTILLHWISALVIFVLFGLGIFMVELDYYDAWYHRAPSLHISLGLTLLILTLIRFSWRILNPKPAPLPTYTNMTHWLATAMKYAFYIVIFALIVTGYLMTTAEGKPASLFGLLDIPMTLQLGPDGVDSAGELHELLAWGIILLTLMHAGAALVHHFVIRDSTLVRIIRPTKAKPDIRKD